MITSLTARMNRARLGPMLIATAMVLAPAAGAIAAEADDSGRYSMSPAEGGFVRLDRQTGAMTFCTKDGAAWNCQPMGDATAAAASEIERLKTENQRLQSDKKNLEEMLGMGEGAKPGPEDGAPAPGQAMKVPTEQDIDKAFDYVEGMVRKFRERVKRLEQESNKDQQL